MCTTIYLRLPSEQAAHDLYAALGQVPVTRPDGGLYWPPKGRFEGYRYDLHVVHGTGAIWRPTGAMVEGDDGPEPVMELVPGYHVNLLWHGPEDLVPAAIEAVRVRPNTPECRFAE